MTPNASFFHYIMCSLHRSIVMPFSHDCQLNMCRAPHNCRKEKLDIEKWSRFCSSRQHSPSIFCSGLRNRLFCLPCCTQHTIVRCNQVIKLFLKICVCTPIFISSERSSEFFFFRFNFENVQKLFGKKWNYLKILRTNKSICGLAFSITQNCCRPISLLNKYSRRFFEVVSVFAAVHNLWMKMAAETRRHATVANLVVSDQFTYFAL